MKLPSLSLKLPDLPKHVAISASVISLSLVLLGVLLPTLGGAADDAVVQNGQFKNQITQAKKDLVAVADDFKFVTDNKDKFESLIQSDRLIPHTRRDAVRQMQALYRQDGLSDLNYDFVMAGDKSVTAVTSQVQAKPTQGEAVSYRVSVETINLKVGAALDGQIYRFIADLGRNFPGAAVVQSVQLQRAPKVTDEILQKLSAGKNSGLVSGEIKFLWRTAQANEPEKK